MANAIRALAMDAVEQAKSGHPGMANTFLLTQGKDVGKSLVEADLVGTARDIMAKAKTVKREIVLPVDAVVAQKFEAQAPSRVVDVDKVNGSDMPKVTLATATHCWR